MFTGLGIRNFKSIGDRALKLELKPLTILVGPNGGGKSTILEALALLAQNAWATEFLKNQSGFRWEGSWVNFAPADLACHRRMVTAPIALNVELEVPEDDIRGAREELETGLSRDPPALLKARDDGFLNRGPHRIAYETAFSLSGGQIAHALNVNGSRFAEARSENPTLVVAGVAGKGISSSLGQPTPRALSSFVGLSSVSTAWMPLLRMSADLVHVALSRRVFYLSAERGGDWVSAEPTPDTKGNMGVGKHGEHTIVHLAGIFGPEGDASSQESVRKWADRFGMKTAVAGLKREGKIGFSFDDPDLAVKLDYRSAGFGSRQLLPVIGLLFASPPDSTVMIEEPEISLHPEGQMAVVEMIADAVTSGRQVLMSTHSKLVVMALRHVVAKGMLDARKVAIYEVTKTGDGTRAQPLDVANDGTVKGWIPSYAKVEDQLWEEWFKLDDQAAPKPG